MLAALLVVMSGVAWAAGVLGLAHLAPEAVLAAGLMLLGASLIVTARTDWSLSRHAWPVVVGVVLVAGLFATSSSFGVAGALSHVSFGDMTAAAAPGRTVYGGFGQLTVTVPTGYASDSVRIESVAGNTVVSLPADVTATVHARVLAGQVCINGHLSNGVGATETEQVGNGARPLTVEVHQLAGQVLIVSRGCQP